MMFIIKNLFKKNVFRIKLLNYKRIGFYLVILALLVVWVYILNIVSPKLSLVVVSCEIILVLSVLLRKDIFPVKYLSIFSSFYFSFIVIIYIPSIFIFLSEKAYSYRFFIGVNFGFLFTLIGVFFADLIFKGTIITKLRKFYSTEIHQLNTFCIFIVIIIYIIVSILLMIYYFKITPSIPLIYLLKHPGSARTSQQMREYSFKLLKTHLIYPLLWLKKFGFAVLNSFLLLLYMSTKRKFYFILLLFVMPMSILFCGATTSRTEVAVLFFVMFLAYWIYKNGRIRFIKIGLFLIGIIIFPILIYLFQSKFKRSIISILLGIGHRIFYIPAYTLYSTFYLFPQYHDFLYGSSIKFLHFIGVTNFFDLGNYLFKFINPNYIISTGTAPAPYIGDFYVNFGFPGIILGSLVVGVTIRILDAFFAMENNKSAVSISIYSYLVLVFCWLNFTSFTTLLITYGVVIVLLLYLVIEILYKYCYLYANNKFFYKLY